MKKIAVVFLCCIALVSCTKKAAEQAGGSQVLASVGNAKITQADYDRELQALPEYARMMFEGEEGKEKLLDEIIKKEILYQEALKKGYDRDAEFQKKMEEFRKLSLISRLFEKDIMAKAAVSDQDVKDFYEKNRQDFSTVSQIKASHILVKTEDEALKAGERLKKGAKFEDIARAVSIDKATAKNGGDLGFFSKGQMVPEFENAATALKAGEISGPVKTPFGYHIIKVTDKKSGPVVDFDKVKGLITQKLNADRQKEVFDSFIDELKKNYKVEINKDALAKSGKQEQPKTAAPDVKPAEKEEKPEKPGDEKPEAKKEEQKTK